MLFTARTEAFISIILDHTIVPAKDNEAAARSFARIFGLTYAGPWGHFAPVQVNDALTLDFSTQEQFGWHHYAFHVSDEEFDQIFSRIQAEDMSYGSGPYSSDDMEIGSPRQGGRTVYFRSPDRHIFEIMTKPQTGT